MSFRTLLGLIVCNLIWSANPTMGKLMLADFQPAQAAWLRYTSALLAYLLGIFILRKWGSLRSRERFGHYFLLPDLKTDRCLIVLLGFMTFFFSPMTQFIGLAGSRATENSLIIAMEPLFTVFLAWIFLGEGMARIHVVAFVIALLGFGLLADLPKAVSAQGWDPHFLANLILLVSLSGEAGYSVLGRKLMLHHPAIPTFGSALAVGVVFLSLGLISRLGMGAFWPPHFSLGSVLALLWLGPLGTAITYLYWMEVLATAPVATMALTLFIQPVVGALWSILFLKERLSLSQDFGGLLIIGAVSAPTLWFSIVPPASGAGETAN